MATLKLYAAEVSPCVRSVLLTIEALNLENIQIVPVDLFQGETNSSDFRKINPIGKVPVLTDGQLTIWDSHAINAYLVDKYGTNDNLYPKSPEKRASINSMNHFDTGRLFAAHDVIIKSILSSPEPKLLDQELAKPLAEAYDLLETILTTRLYVAGNQLSIADFSIATTLSQSQNYLPLIPGKHERILAWYRKMTTLPYFGKVNDNGLNKVKEVLKEKLMR
ncbi:hypothetical protein ABEB36_000999 [Hypothenemus hampei]|uniref:Glutathione transferase n=1 Tax=Hypothenemus hampei TaxID=57062 RepID=A0ABD1FE06_HYPHA